MTEVVLPSYLTAAANLTLTLTLYGLVQPTANPKHACMQAFPVQLIAMSISYSQQLAIKISLKLSTGDRPG